MPSIAWKISIFYRFLNVSNNISTIMLLSYFSDLGVIHMSLIAELIYITQIISSHALVFKIEKGIKA